MKFSELATLINRLRTGGSKHSNQQQRGPTTQFIPEPTDYSVSEADEPPSPGAPSETPPLSSTTKAASRFRYPTKFDRKAAATLTIRQKGPEVDQVQSGSSSIYSQPGFASNNVRPTDAINLTSSRDSSDSYLPYDSQSSFDSQEPLGFTPASGRPTNAFAYPSSLSLAASSEYSQEIQEPQSASPSIDHSFADPESDHGAAVRLIDSGEVTPAKNEGFDLPYSASLTLSDSSLQKVSNEGALIGGVKPIEKLSDKLGSKHSLFQEASDDFLPDPNDRTFENITGLTPEIGNGDKIQGGHATTKIVEGILPDAPIDRGKSADSSPGSPVSPVTPVVDRTPGGKISYAKALAKVITTADERLTAFLNTDVSAATAKKTRFYKDVRYNPFVNEAITAFREERKKTNWRRGAAAAADAVFSRMSSNGVGAGTEQKSLSKNEAASRGLEPAGLANQSGVHVAGDSGHGTSLLGAEEVKVAVNRSSLSKDFLRNKGMHENLVGDENFLKLASATLQYAEGTLTPDVPNSRTSSYEVLAKTLNTARAPKEDELQRKIPSSPDLPRPRTR